MAFAFNSSNTGRFLFDIFKLEKDYSGWSARFWVDLSPFYDVTFPGVHLDLENFDPDGLFHDVRI